MTNRDKLQTILRRTFGIAMTVDVRLSKYGESLGSRNWDSLNSMVLCTNIEEEFNVLLEIDMMAKLRSYYEAERILTSLGINLEEQCSSLIM